MGRAVSVSRSTPLALSRWQSAQFLRLLRAELDRMGLDHVGLEVLGPAVDWQGAFVEWDSGALSILIGATTDPRATLHHEAIHALRSMGAFTSEEWSSLRARAVEDWIERFDIASRYPDLSDDDRIEEAVAEAFAAFGRGELEVQRPEIGLLRRIGRIIEAFGSAFSRLIVPDPVHIFGKIGSGQIGARLVKPTQVGGSPLLRLGR